MDEVEKIINEIDSQEEIQEVWSEEDTELFDVLNEE